MDPRTVVKPLAVLGAVLVLGTGTAAAATGSALLLGRSNTASTQTQVKNTGTGATLVLTAARGGQAPLTASAGSGKAANLNADKVDGLDGSALALAAGRVGSVTANGEAVDLDEDGTPDALFAYAMCPAGSKVTGGGFEDYASGPAVISTARDNGWLFVTLMTAADSNDDAVAQARCYNPRGTVAGALDQRTVQGASRLTAADVEHVREAVAKQR